MWILQLNDIRSPKVEILTVIAKAETKEMLLSFLDREKVKAYDDGQGCKSFRSGGPLEWFYPPFERRAETYWDDEIGSLPTV